MMNRRELLVAASTAPLALLYGGDATIENRIWSPPVDPALILKNGPEGIDRRPKPPFSFIEEDLGGSNPKMKVRDKAGVTWNVKWAEEVHAETFASRLAAAAGYFVRTAYFVPAGRISGCEGLGRAKSWVEDDGSFQAASFKLIPKSEPYSADHNWGWRHNPFLERPELRTQLNGLKVMLMLTSNWDAKDARDADIGSNTAVYEAKRRGRIEYRYAFDDWGGSMGRWGNVLNRSKWDVAGYVEQSPDFVQGVDDDGFVKWGYSGTHDDDVTREIDPADVAWLLQSLRKIGDVDMIAALMDAGAREADAARYASALRLRLTQLQQVAL